MESRARFHRNINRKCAILAAATAFLQATASPAVTISGYYIDGQIATNSKFTQGLQNIDLSASAPTVNLPSGDYFRFGVSLVVTNNPNPAAGGAWNLGNQAIGNPAQPQNLGLAGIALDIPEGGAAGYSLSPVLGPSTGSNPPNYSTAKFNPSVYLFDDTIPGVIESDAVTGMDIMYEYLPHPES